MPRHFIALMSGLSVLVFHNVCFSTLVSVDFSGIIEFAVPGNDFGLAVGDPLFGNTTYDDTLLTGVGSEQLGYAGICSPCGTSLTFTIGTQVLSINDDDRAFFPDTVFPLVFFENGAVVGFDYATAGSKLVAPSSSTFADFSVFGTSWHIADANEGGFIAHGSYNRFSAPTPVPEPSINVCLLFGLGLPLLLSALWRRQGYRQLAPQP